VVEVEARELEIRTVSQVSGGLQRESVAIATMFLVDKPSIGVVLQKRKLIW